MKDIFNQDGKVAQPLILWMLGVPGFLCFVLWFFIWRGQ